MPRPFKKILITGATGFIGSKLLSALRENPESKVEGPDPSALDLHDFESIHRIVSSDNWDVIIHLAAVGHVPTCEKDPGTAYRTNVLGTSLLLESISRHCPGAHLIYSSTAQAYSAPAGSELTRGLVMDESRAIAPQNVYAKSKWQGEVLIRDAAGRGQVRATVLRMFNHTHKSQSPDFFLPHLYSTLAKARAGETLSVPVGNLNIHRDIGALSDLIEAFKAVIASGGPDSGSEVYNVCSGEPKHLGRLAESLARRMNVKARFVEDPSRIRPGEPQSVHGSHDKLTKATGWRPRYRTEEQLLDYFLS